MMNVALLTALAMAAFAANSVLCRLALGSVLVDPASFASIRVISGALVLAVILSTRRGSRSPTVSDWRMVLALFGYMVLFSFAYMTLSAGTGALILFAAVQLTMFSVALSSGERFGALSWVGLTAAFGGLIILVAPGITAPDPVGAALMAAAGVSWGVYSLLGRGATNPLAATANNFVFCVPLVVAVSILFYADLRVSFEGVLLAAVSGGIASGIGYAIWYRALRDLTATRAATVQLSVPAIAACVGVVFLDETISPRLLVATAATLGGVWLVLAQRVKSDAP